MNNLNASTVANKHISRPAPPAVRKVTLILPAYNEEVSIGSIILRSKEHADRVIVIDEGSTDRTDEVAGLAGAENKIKPQINVDERRYMKPLSAFICVHPRLISIIHHSMEAYA